MPGLMVEHDTSSEEEFSFDRSCRIQETDNPGTAEVDGLEQQPDDFVFPSCPLQLLVTTSSVFILLFILQHKLSNAAAQSLLELMTAHFPPGHKAVTSMYRLKTLFQKKFQTAQHSKPLVCSLCEDLLPDTETRCPRPECKDAAVPPNEFVMFDVETVLAQLFRYITLMNFVTVFLIYFCRSSILFRAVKQLPKRDIAPVVSDIVNGTNYKKLQQMNVEYQSKWRVTLTLNTDGVAIFKTSAS